MTGANHALAGASIAIIVDKPIIALPLALLSHFLLDIVPHFGEEMGQRKNLSRSIWAVSITLMFIVFGWLIYEDHWMLFIAALVAVSPDFAWVYRFVIDEKFGKLPPKPKNKFNEFHAGIQKYERKWGIFVEIPVFIFLLNFVWQNL